MTDTPIDHQRILRVSKILKSFDLEDKAIALTILSNILTVYVETGTNRSIAVTQQEDEDEPGFTVATHGPGLQLFIPREAIDPDRATSIN
jgi:hypothetical protein